MQVARTLGWALVLLLGATVSGYGQNMGNMGSMGMGTYPAGVKVEKTAMGPVLADAKGMTLYTFDGDKMAGKSACNGPCAQNWPPLAAKADAKPMGAWTVVTRDDGAKQWAYKGKPLYAFAKDMKPGDTTGNGFKDVWHVAKP